jgi:hypothetical protein
MTCKCQCRCKEQGLPLYDLCPTCETLWNMGSEDHGLPYVPMPNVDVVELAENPPAKVDAAIDKAAEALGV